MHLPRTILLVAALLPTGLAQAASAQQVALETLTGGKFVGTVLADDGTTVKLRTGSGEMGLPIGGLTPSSQFTLRRLKVGDDARALLALAEWCVDVALYPEARQTYKEALEADYLMEREIHESIAKARTRASRDVLQRAKDLQADGKHDESRALLTRLVQELPLEVASQEAAKLLADDLVERKAAATKVPVQTPAGNGEQSAQMSPEAQVMFAKAIERYHKMLDLEHKGLTTESQSTAIDLFQKALKELEAAYRDAQSARHGGHNPPPDLATVLTEIDRRYRESNADLRIHIADAYLLRSSYKQAADILNQGLAKDAQNPRLIAARERVTAAANSNDNGWGFGGRLRR